MKHSNLQAVNELAEVIAAEIRSRGVIPFARFMELALYCPVYGYYEREQDNPGRSGDYYTSVSVGRLFGELLAAQFAEWLEEPGNETVTIAEAGAHDGRLAADVLGWLRRRRPALFARLQYCIVEPSDRRRAWQERRLADFSGTVRWTGRLSGLLGANPPGGSGQAGGVRGILFSNELLDAMPVHRLRWNATQQTWIELGVAIENGRFAWQETPGPPPASRPWPPVLPGHCPAALLAVLPDGFTLEVGLAALAWWREAAQLLEQGRLLTIDYGLSTEEFFAPERRDGTLRAYTRHHQSADLLAQPGSQDLTAHIDFSALRAAGQAAGLQTEALLTQEGFLTRIAARLWQGQTDFGPWTPRHSREFRTLTHPEFLGRPFRVLIQRRYAQHARSDIGP